MKHATKSVMQSCNPVILPKATKPLDHLFRAIFDGVGHNHDGGNAFDTVALNLDTYGKATHATWDFDAGQQGCRAARLISKAERKDKRQDAKWVRDFIPAMQPGSPVMAKPCSRVIVAAGSQDRKRFRVEVTQPNGEREEIMCSLVTNSIFIASYGKIVEFRCSSRAVGTFVDCRDMKRKPLSFAKSELRRFLGVTEGDARYTELTCFPAARQPKSKDTFKGTSPGNPSPTSPVTPVTGQLVAGQQGQASQG